MQKSLFSVLLFLLIFNACTSPEKADLILTNVTIVDAENNQISENQLIAITKNRISAVDDVENLNNYSSETIIDLSGKYVIPGLWDNHVHFRGGTELIKANKELLPMMLAHGITTVRDGGGDITPEVQMWNEQILAGELDGPQIFTPGPKLDGTRPAWDGSISVTDAESVSFAIDSLQSIDADFVKIYDGNLTAESFYEIIKQAEQAGLKSTGHMPLSADLFKAIELGLDGTEHLYYVLKSASPELEKIEQEHNGYGMITPLMETFDEEYAAENFKKMAQNEFYVTPTLFVGKTLAELLITDHSTDEMLEYIDPELQQTYQRRLASAQRGGERYTAQRAFWVESFREMIKPLNDSGVLLLAGSDSGPFNSFVYPGPSIHKELQLLVDAGLTPAEALVTSYINGSKFFDLENEYGRIKQKFMADLLILNTNPLENIRNTEEIFGVLKNGSWYGHQDLEKLMDSIRN